MIEVCRLTKRHVDPAKKEKIPQQLEQVKIFSLVTGHGVGTVDFVEKVSEIDEEDYDAMVKKCGDYARFKLGNLSRYFEVEIFPEHVARLLPQMPECPLRDQFMNLKEGYIILRKSL